MNVFNRLLVIFLMFAGLVACSQPAAVAPTSGTASSVAANAVSTTHTEQPAAVVPLTPEATSTPEPTATPEPTSTPEIVAGASRNAPLPEGSEVRLPSWSVTITSVVCGEEAAKAIAAANQFNEPPHEGMMYLLATMRLENISEEQEAKSVSFGVSVGVTGSRNMLYGSASVVEPKPLEGELFPGGIAEGQMAFEVPADETNLMFEVGESFSFTEPPQFVAIDAGAQVMPDAALSDVKATDAGTRRNTPAAVGDTVVSDDWEVRVLEIVRGEKALQLAQEANQFNDPPEEGFEYVAVRVHAHYIGTNEPDNAVHIDDGFLQVTGAKNVVYERPSVVEPDPKLDAYLFPGGETEGWAVLSAATGEENLVLIFEPFFSLGSGNTRFLSLSQ